jgi:hypothetical protein
MIVLDEQLIGINLAEDIRRWWQGQVRNITDLRPDTIIPDEAIPALLHHARQPTFVTINTDDFWRKTPASGRYCIVCCELPGERAEEIAGWLRALFRLPEFKTKSARMGKVVRVTSRNVQY